MKDTLELKSIPLDQIEYNPVNTKIFNMDDIEHLAKTIKEEGYNYHILVFKNKNGEFLGKVESKKLQESFDKLRSVVNKN